MNHDDYSNNRRCHCPRKDTKDGSKLVVGRNLVVCIDGTSNQFGPKNSNVVELYSRLAKDENQLTYYNSGIGTYAKPSWRSLSYWKQVVDHRIDLAIAWHFETIVLKAYRWLSDNYQAGDRIFLFGFSRGAYQVRVLAGMIDKVGLIHKGNEEQIPFAFELYASDDTGDFKKEALSKLQKPDPSPEKTPTGRPRRGSTSTNVVPPVATNTVPSALIKASEKLQMKPEVESQTRAPHTKQAITFAAPTRVEDPDASNTSLSDNGSNAANFKSIFSRKDVRVHFVGAWDTVSSIGIVRGKNFPSTTSHHHTCYFRHALAMDERRVKFLPEYAFGGLALPNSLKHVEAQLKEDNTAAVAAVLSDKTPTQEEAKPPKDESTVVKTTGKAKPSAKDDFKSPKLNVVNDQSRPQPTSTSKLSVQGPTIVALKHNVEESFSVAPHIKEVWFYGTHSDIGGGHLPNETRDKRHPAFLWMVYEAQSAGLKIDEKVAGQKEHEWSWDQLGQVHESLTRVWKVFEWLPFRRLTYKDFEDFTWRPHYSEGRIIQPGQLIHASLAFCGKGNNPDIAKYQPKARLADNFSRTNRQLRDLVRKGNIHQLDWMSQWADVLELDIFDFTVADAHLEKLKKACGDVAKEKKYYTNYIVDISSSVHRLSVMTKTEEGFQSLTKAAANLSSPYTVDKILGETLSHLKNAIVNGGQSTPSDHDLWLSVADILTELSGGRSSDESRMMEDAFWSLHEKKEELLGKYVCDPRCTFSKWNMLLHWAMENEKRSKCLIKLGLFTNNWIRPGAGISASDGPSKVTTSKPSPPKFRSYKPTFAGENRSSVSVESRQTPISQSMTRGSSRSEMCFLAFPRFWSIATAPSQDMLSILVDSLTCDSILAANAAALSALRLAKFSDSNEHVRKYLTDKLIGAMMSNDNPVVWHCGVKLLIHEECSDEKILSNIVTSLVDRMEHADLNGAVVQVVRAVDLARYERWRLLILKSRFIENLNKWLGYPQRDSVLTLALCRCIRKFVILCDRQSLESFLNTLDLQLLLRHTYNGDEDVKEAAVFCVHQILKLVSSEELLASRKLHGLFKPLLVLVSYDSSSNEVLQFGIRSIGDLCDKSIGLECDEKLMNFFVSTLCELLEDEDSVDIRSTTESCISRLAQSEQFRQKYLRSVPDRLFMRLTGEETKASNEDEFHARFKDNITVDVWNCLENLLRFKDSCERINVGKGCLIALRNGLETGGPIAICVGRCIAHLVQYQRLQFVDLMDLLASVKDGSLSVQYGIILIVVQFMQDENLLSNLFKEGIFPPLFRTQEERQNCVVDDAIVSCIATLAEFDVIQTRLENAGLITLNDMTSDAAPAGEVPLLFARFVQELLNYDQLREVIINKYSPIFNRFLHILEHIEMENESDEDSLSDLFSPLAPRIRRMDDDTVFDARYFVFDAYGSSLRSAEVLSYILRSLESDARGSLQLHKLPKLFEHLCGRAEGTFLKTAICSILAADPISSRESLDTSNSIIQLALNQERIRNIVILKLITSAKRVHLSQLEMQSIATVSLEESGGLEKNSRGIVLETFQTETSNIPETSQRQTHNLLGSFPEHALKSLLCKLDDSDWVWRVSATCSIAALACHHAFDDGVQVGTIKRKLHLLEECDEDYDVRCEASACLENLINKGNGKCESRFDETNFLKDLNTKLSGNISWQQHHSAIVLLRLLLKYKNDRFGTISWETLGPLPTTLAAVTRMTTNDDDDIQEAASECLQYILMNISLRLQKQKEDIYAIRLLSDLMLRLKEPSEGEPGSRFLLLELCTEHREIAELLLNDGLWGDLQDELLSGKASGYESSILGVMTALLSKGGVFPNETTTTFAPYLSYLVEALEEGSKRRIKALVKAISTLIARDSMKNHIPKTDAQKVLESAFRLLKDSDDEVKFEAGALLRSFVHEEIVNDISRRYLEHVEKIKMGDKNVRCEAMEYLYIYFQHGIYELPTSSNQFKSRFRSAIEDVLDILEAGNSEETQAAIVLIVKLVDLEVERIDAHLQSRGIVESFILGLKDSESDTRQCFAQGIYSLLSKKTYLEALKKYPIIALLANQLSFDRHRPSVCSALRTSIEFLLSDDDTRTHFLKRPEACNIFLDIWKDQDARYLVLPCLLNLLDYFNTQDIVLEWFNSQDVVFQMIALLKHERSGADQRLVLKFIAKVFGDSREVIDATPKIIRHLLQSVIDCSSHSRWSVRTSALECIESIISRLTNPQWAAAFIELRIPIFLKLRLKDNDDDVQRATLHCITKLCKLEHFTTILSRSSIINVALSLLSREDLSPMQVQKAVLFLISELATGGEQLIDLEMSTPLGQCACNRQVIQKATGR